MTAVVPGVIRQGRLELLETPQGLRDGPVQVVLIEMAAKPTREMLTFGKYRTGEMSDLDSFKVAEWRGDAQGNGHG